MKNERDMTTRELDAEFDDIMARQKWTPTPRPKVSATPDNRAKGNRPVNPMGSKFHITQYSYVNARSPNSVPSIIGRKLRDHGGWVPNHALISLLEKVRPDLRRPAASLAAAMQALRARRDIESRRTAMQTSEHRWIG